MRYALLETETQVISEQTEVRNNLCKYPKKISFERVNKTDMNVQINAADFS